jgi:hypothetical protein
MPRVAILVIDGHGIVRDGLTILPVDRLKLDRSLTHSLTFERKSAAVVSSIVSLCEVTSMRSMSKQPIKASSARPRPTPPEDGFDGLGEVFLARLQGDRRHLVGLSAALARADDDPRPIFDALRYSAHRMRGTAAIFEFAEVAVAARELEQAAECALIGQAHNTDASVWSALVALVQLLAQMDGGRAWNIGGVSGNRRI